MENAPNNTRLIKRGNVYNLHLSNSGRLYRIYAGNILVCTCYDEHGANRVWKALEMQLMLEIFNRNN